MTLSNYRKGIVAVVTFVATLLTLGVIPEAAQPYVLAAFAALNAIGVVAIPNTPPRTPEAGQRPGGLLRP